MDTGAQVHYPGVQQEVQHQRTQFYLAYKVNKSITKIPVINLKNNTRGKVISN